MWKEVLFKYRGVRVEGDKKVPPTRWWNYHLLLWWGWKTVAVLQVSPEDAKRGYQIGFRASNGEAKIMEQSVFHRRFRMRIGREDCTFFALKDGQEIPLSLVARVKKNDPQYVDVPLY